jgi:hypothetical protein
MKYRIGNWVINQDFDNVNKPYQVTLETLQLIYNERDENKHPLPVELSRAWLLDFDWPLDRKRDKDKEIDGLWIKNSITIVERAWDGDFYYATYVRYSGEFKGGFSIKYVHQLQNLYHAFSNIDIERKPYYTL